MSSTSYLVPFLTFFFGLLDRSVSVHGVELSRDLSQEFGAGFASF